MASEAEKTGADGGPPMNWPPQFQESGTNLSPSAADTKAQEGPRMSSLKSSRAYSVASPAADQSRRAPLKANNPGSIPTAGGVALGVRATQDREQRRASMMSDRDAQKASQSLALDREGSPDPATQNNTQVNTIPARMQADNGEGSSKLDTMNETQEPVAPSSGPPFEPAGAEFAKENEKPTVNAVPSENAVTADTNDVKPTTSEVKPDTNAITNTTSPTNATKTEMPQGRRASRMDNLLGKFRSGSGSKK